MTFSDRSLVKALKKNWRCAWRTLNGEDSAGSSFAHNPKDPAPSCGRGNGEHNVQILFLTPQGQLLNVVAGYLDARDLLTEIRRSEKIAKAIQGKRSEAANKIVRRMQTRDYETIKKNKSRGGFASFARNRRLADHKFVSRNPLMSWEEFETEKLVGKSRTFFGSSNGGKKKERIGRDRSSGQSGFEGPEDVEELMRRLLEGSQNGQTPQKKKRGPSSRPSKDL